MPTTVDSPVEQVLAAAWPAGPPRAAWTEHEAAEPLEVPVRHSERWFADLVEKVSEPQIDLALLRPAAQCAADDDVPAGTSPPVAPTGSAPTAPTAPTAPAAPAAPERAATDDPEIAALQAALDALTHQPPTDLPPTAALSRSKALLRARQQVEALALRAISDVDTRKLYAQDDRPSTTDWVKAQDIPGLGAAQVTLAKRLRRLPTVQSEVLACRLSSAAAAAVGTAMAKAAPHLDLPGGLIDGLDAEAALYGVLVDGICTLLAEQTGGAGADDPQQHRLRAELEALNDPTLAHRPRVEAGFVLFAARVAPARLASGLDLLLDGLLPDQHGKRAKAAEDDRGFDLHRKHGGSGWIARGDLDDETGELLATVLDAAAATDPANPTDTTAWREGQQSVVDDTLAPEDWPAAQPRPRSKRQQRHDALRLGLRALLDSKALGVRGKAAPHVVVVVENDYLHAVPGALPGRTTHGARVHRDQLRRLLCDSTFTRMLRDARKRIVEVSHTQRTLTALERLVLHVQTGGSCAHCGRGPADGVRIVPHHPELFSRTGITSLADAIGLCEPSHDHQLHAQRRAITLLDGRVLGPDGWIRREPRRRP